MPFRVKARGPRVAVDMEEGETNLRPGERVVWTGEADTLEAALRAAAATPEGAQLVALQRFLARENGDAS